MPLSKNANLSLLEAKYQLIMSELKSKVFYIYILECINGAYYTGYTIDIERRYQEHCLGSLKCKYTRSFPPVKLLAYWEMSFDLSNVLKIEALIKKLSKDAKKSIVNNPDLLQTKLCERNFMDDVVNHIKRII